MSSTNKTTYYELPQFVDNDIFNPLVDDNDAYDKIDTALHNIADAEADDASEIVGIKSRLDSAEGDIDALEAQNGNNVLTTTAQTLSGAVNELDADVSALDDRLDIVEDDINNASTGLKVKVSALETQNGDEALTTTAQTLSGAVNELHTKKLSKYANVASMILDTELTIDNVVETLGYNSVGDFGGAFYEIVDNNSTGHCEALSNGKYAKLIPTENGVTLQMLGVTNETSDIASAIEEAQSISDIVIIAGELTLATDVRITKTIKGANRYAKITLNGGCFVFSNFTRSFEDLIIVNNNANKFALDCTYVRETASFRNIHITGGNGISITKSWYFIFENIRCEVKNTTGTGIRIYNRDDGGVNAVSFSNVHCQGGLHNLVFTNDSEATSPLASEALVFSGCAMEDSAGSAIYIDAPTRFDSLTFLGCYFEGCNSSSLSDYSIVEVDNYTNSGAYIGEVLNCLTRISASVNKPLFSGGFIVDNLYNAISHPAFDTNSPTHNVILNSYNVGNPIPFRFVTGKNDGLTSFVPENQTILNRMMNKAYGRGRITKNTENVFDINFNGNQKGCGYVDLMMVIESDSTNRNIVKLRIMYVSIANSSLAKVEVLDNLGTNGNISNVAFSADVDFSDYTNNKVKLKVTPTDYFFTGDTYIILTEGFDFIAMNDGSSFTITQE